MGNGYTRNDVSNNIADGNIINASDLDGEFDAVESAFNSSTGHTHDGTSAEGGPITVVGPVQDLVVSATEVKPKTTNTLDLGTSALLYKDAYLQGNMYFRDTALKIVSSADGQLDIDADVELELVAPTVDIDASTALTVDTASTTFTSTLFNVTGSANITGDLDVDNINIDGNTIISTDTNGDINITPNGTGAVNITATTNITGDLDVDNININGNTISSTDTNGDITLAPNGTGVVALSSTDLTFGDNDKAIFGAGSDLQIYSDGSTSYITESGPGNLRINGATVQITDTSFNKYFQGSGDTTRLYYADGEKLATTATGVDVTGTITSDGLTVEDSSDATIQIKSTKNGTWTIGESLGSLDFFGSDTSGSGAGVKSSIQSNAGVANGAGFGLDFFTHNTSTLNKRISVDYNGDISFYDNTGVTQGLFWDASTQRLGLGTTSPNNQLEIKSDTATVVARLACNTGSGRDWGLASATDGIFGIYDYDASSYRMTIDSSGNVKINSGVLQLSSEGVASGIINAEEGLFFNADSNGTGGGGFEGQIIFGSGRSTTSGGTEYMRIEGTSFFIGKTSANLALTGIQATSSGQALSVTRDGGAPFNLNRLTSDGELMGLYQDTTQVGGIGANATYPYIANTVNVGLRFVGSDIRPSDSTGADRDNAIDLGDAVSRFKDLYLSGDVDTSGVFKGTNGTAAVPTHSFLNDPDNGMFRPTTNTVGFSTGGSEAMRIDSSGRLGVNFTPTGSNAKVFIGGGSARTAASDTADEGIVLVPSASLSTNGYTPYLSFTPNASNPNRARAAIGAVSTNGTAALDLVFATRNAADGTAITGNDEKVRITSGGELLVGKTSNDATTVGANIRADKSFFTSSGQEALVLNRNTSDGTILELRKANGTAGSIGGGSGFLTIGSSTGNLAFYTGLVLPTASSSGATSNGVIDLGNSSNRFKDLYLSGGAYLGGTAAANLLDDYEEGTWTGTVSANYGFTPGASVTINGNYVKIGDMVNVNCSIDFDTAETLALGDRFIIQGIPFIMTGSQNGVGGGSFIQPGSFASGTHVVGTVASNSNSQDELMCVVTRVNGTPPALNNTNVNLGMTYKLTNTF